MMNPWDELSYEVKLGAPYLFVEGYLMDGYSFYFAPFIRTSIYWSMG